MAVAYATEIERLRADKDALAYQVDHFVAECDRWAVENKKLRAALDEYACTGTDKPCGCYELLSKEKTEIDKLRTALEQLHKLFGHIDGINDERDSVPILLEARRIVDVNLHDKPLVEPARRLPGSNPSYVLSSDMAVLELTGQNVELRGEIKRLRAALEAARPYVEYCAAGSKDATAALGEIDALRRHP